MQLQVTLRLQFRYSHPASASRYELRLAPLAGDQQRVRDFSLRTSPPASVRAHSEPGGTVHLIELEQTHGELMIEMDARVETIPYRSADNLNVAVDDWDLYRDPQVTSGYAEFLAPTRLAPAIEEANRIAEVARKRAEGPSAAAFVTCLALMLHRLHLRHGAAGTPWAGQDLVHAMLAASRSQGIPARYVSGYVYRPNGASGGREEGSMTGWVECLLFRGAARPVWRGFDPVVGVRSDERYVKAHVGRDYHDVTPVRGAFRGEATHAMDLWVRVRRDEP